MANIKTLKKKLKTTKSTLKITSAMKLVSAAKMNKFQDKLYKSLSYTDEMVDVVYKCVSQDSSVVHSMLQKTENNFKHILIISSNRGLCGSYNSQIANLIKHFIKDDKNQFRMSFCGSKAKEILKFDNVGKTYQFHSGLKFEEFIKTISMDFINEFISCEIGEVYVAYNSYKGGGSYKPVIRKVLPFELDEQRLNENIHQQISRIKNEPGQEEALDFILPEAIKSIFYNCFLNAEATEHAARMIAMDSAAKNCKEAIRTLNLKINKRRQASITKELIEIVSGAESL